MKAFLVEGYNKSDYITNIVNWEPLKYFETLQKSFIYMEEMKHLDYDVRVRLTDLPQNPTQTEHWCIII